MSLVHITIGKTNTTSSLLPLLRPGDRATIATPHGQELSGRVVMKFATHAVLNLGGKFGRPGIADDSNLLRVSLKREGCQRIDATGNVSTSGDCLIAVRG